LRCSVFRFTSSLCMVLALAYVSAAPCHAQAPVLLSQVKRLYVDSLGTDRGAAEMREQMIRRLQKSRDVEVVTEGTEADAVIRGTGRRWVTGHVSLNPRSHSSGQPTYEGYLSVEVVSKNGDTLWSYLVSPSSFSWNGVADDLARQLVGKLLAAMKGKSEDQPQTAAADPLDQPQGKLQGAGATFPAPLYQRWFELFEELHPGVHIGYDAIGSAEGIERLKEHKVEFAASEMPLSDEVMAKAHQHFQHLPAVLGAVVVIYNVKGLHRTLNFTPNALAGIFLGKIKKWNNPEIRKANPGISLPDGEIGIVHRSDGSGTTFVWTDYLSRISPQWKASVGSDTTVKWPAGVGAQGNEGVAAMVQKTPNSIGYVEFIYAIQHELSFGAVRNLEGEFVKASISSVTAAAGATAQSPGAAEDFRVSITNPPGKNSYPIATYTWLLIPERIEDTNEKNVLKELLRWVLTSGQKKCSALGYAPLPAEVAKRALDSFGP
jgi:phosphate ABC transporter phosphate-binding protein